jgi:predicted lipase
MYKTMVLEGLQLSEDARMSEDQVIAKYPGAIFLEDVPTDTQGFIWYHEGIGELIIAFRGTQQSKDWLTDFNAFHTVFPYGNKDTKIQVHRGFMNAYLKVRPKIHKYVSMLNKSLKFEAIIAGHSLGGALATLCAVDLQYNFNFPILCLISGNPMVGNKYFVKSFNKRVPKTIRTYMRRDIVPNLPPSWFQQRKYHGYSQHGTSNPIGPRSPFFGIIMFFKKRFKNKDSILDDLFNHDINLYREEVIK